MLLNLIGFLLKLAFTILGYIYIGIIGLTKLMLKPFKLLFSVIKDALSSRYPIPYSLDDRFYAFNGFMPFLLFAAALIYTVIVLCISFCHWDSDSNYVQHLLFNTTLGSFFGFMSGGLDFSPAAIIAIAFSGSLLPLCMSAHESNGIKPRWFVRAPCYIVYLIASSSLAVMLTGLFGVVGQWGFDTIVNLFNQESSSFFATAGKILALIPLCYIALLLSMIAVRTYAESFIFGLLGMIVLIILAFLTQLIPQEYYVLGDIVESILVLGMFFGLDILQGKAVAKFEESLEDMYI